MPWRQRQRLQGGSECGNAKGSAVAKGNKHMRRVLLRLELANVIPGHSAMARVGALAGQWHVNVKLNEVAAAGGIVKVGGNHSNKRRRDGTYRPVAAKARARSIACSSEPPRPLGSLQ